MSINLTWMTNDAVIRRLAGGSSYQRGLDYFSQRQVESLEDWRRLRSAPIVRGNQRYHVIPAADDEVPEYSCDCPVGSDGVLQALRRCGARLMNCAAETVEGGGRRKTKELTLVDAGKILQAKDKDTL
ncbi:MAG: hypothetical protein IPP47_19280 [Bryobacterales bacterium]|nr:hypothetical protein [Bryobacterales bacterium]